MARVRIGGRISLHRLAAAGAHTISNTRRTSCLCSVSRTDSEGHGVYQNRSNIKMPHYGQGGTLTARIRMVLMHFQSFSEKGMIAVVAFMSYNSLHK